ncbi:hypothetical protein [Tenacibaculum aquimarinum]|uniref:hypothetical protein n=1 Tax=Tenacibaculum aquimarinum TaxID=2910675 RepID=UPI001F0B616D|nr:hypothetical protein [Tenacibaculum aquimarinum]MCH3883480.1 hypothetical protein [Tenacibaculum aquimarinum]
MNKSTVKSFFYFLFFYIGTINGQNIDSFYNSSLANIEEDFIRLNRVDKINISKAYLLKAKQDNNPIKIANGYYLKTLTYSHKKVAVIYTDSIIQASAVLEDKTILAKGYLQKGIQNYYQSQYNAALDNYIIAKKYFEKTNNKIGILTVRHYIGVLKSVSFKLDESLQLFKDNFNYLVNNNLDTVYRSQYLKSLLSLSVSYSRNEILDSAEVYFLKGIKETKNEDEYLYSHFLAGYGANSYIKQDYNTSLDNFKKATYFLKTKEIV